MLPEILPLRIALCVEGCFRERERVRVRVRVRVDTVLVSRALRLTLSVPRLLQGGQLDF